MALAAAAYAGWPVAVLALSALLTAVLALVHSDVRGADRRSGEGTAALHREVVAHGRTTESELQSAERFRAVIDSAHDAIIAIDTEGRIDTFNNAAERIFGTAAARSSARTSRC